MLTIYNKSRNNLILICYFIDDKRRDKTTQFFALNFATFFCAAAAPKLSDKRTKKCPNLMVSIHICRRMHACTVKG